MSRYEIGFIITPEVSEEECKKIIDSVLATIKKSGGAIESQNEWGLKPLAYPIQKHTDGFFVFLIVEISGNAVAAIERRLRQMEKIIRFIIFRLDDKLAKAHKLTKKWKKMEHFSKRSRETAKEESEIEETNLEEIEEETRATN